MIEVYIVLSPCPCPSGLGTHGSLVLPFCPNIILFLIFSFFSIDATKTDCLGRYVNDSWPLTTKNAYVGPIIDHERLCLGIFASKNIAVGEEVRYNYGAPNLPWRKRKQGKFKTL